MLEVDKKTFEDEVLKAEGYVFVDFFGDGCVRARLCGRSYTKWQINTEIRSNSHL